MPARQKYRGSPSYVVSNYADSLYLSSKISALVVDLLHSIKNWKSAYWGPGVFLHTYIFFIHEIWVTRSAKDTKFVLQGPLVDYFANKKNINSIHAAMNDLDFIIMYIHLCKKTFIFSILWHLKNSVDLCAVMGIFFSKVEFTSPLLQGIIKILVISFSQPSQGRPWRGRSRQGSFKWH